jgi:uncharacterized protein YciI
MYSIYDEGPRRLMTAGRNSPTKEAAKDALLHYLSGTCSKVELAALSTQAPDELAARLHYKILGTSPLTGR